MRISFKRGNITYLLISGLIYIAAVFGIPLMLSPEINVYTRLNIILTVSLAATIILIIYSLRVDNDIERGGTTDSLLVNIAIGLIGFMAMMFLQMAINILLQYLANFYNFETTSQNTSNIVDILKRKPLFAIYVTILGPIMEELFFRKAIFGYFYDTMLGSGKIIRFVLPATITGIIFALPHDGVSPIMIIYIVMSFVFSYLYVKTKSMVAPMTAHIAMNTLVIAIQLVAVN